MDPNIKLPKLNYTGIAVAIALGVIVAVGLYQAQIRGLLPSNISLPKTPGLQTQIIVSEENAVINVVEKTSDSVVAIGVSRRGLSEDATKLKVGQTVIAIGNALGRFTNTVTTGVVSGLGRKVIAGSPFEGSLESLDNLIQTDAAINLGNSGGPLLNSGGQVIGVNVATTEGAQNIGFAIPINSVKAVVDEFVANGFISRPFLGIQYRFISKDVAILNEVPQGAYVQDLVEGGPAIKAGVRAGDIITKINGESIDEEGKVAEIISKANIGSTLDLVIWRDGKEIKLKATVSESPQQ